MAGRHRLSPIALVKGVSVSTMQIIQELHQIAVDPAVRSGRPYLVGTTVTVKKGGIRPRMNPTTRISQGSDSRVGSRRLAG